MAPATCGRRGTSPSGLFGNVSVRASHAWSGSRAGRFGGLRSGRSHADSTPSGRDQLAPQSRPAAASLFTVQCRDTVLRGLDPRRPGPAYYNSQKALLPGHQETIGERLGLGLYLNSFPTPEGTRRAALPEVPGSGSRVWAELPGWSRASLRLRWRRSIPSLPKANCSCRRRHLLGTMAPGLPRSFRQNWQRSELRSRVRSVGGR